MSGSILERDRYFERQQRRVSAVRQVERVGQREYVDGQVRYIIMPPQIDALRRFNAREIRYERLFNTSFFVQDYLVRQVPASDSMRNRLVIDEGVLFARLIHTEVNQELCGNYAIIEAANSWSTITYRCIGCNNTATVRGALVND